MDLDRAMNVRRHPLVARSRPARLVGQPRGLPQVYRGGTRKVTSDVYDVDHAARRGGRFRWLLSTCVAAGVGAIAIGVVLVGSMEQSGESDRTQEILKRLRDASIAPQVELPRPTPGGIAWSAPKTDKLQATTSFQSSVRQIIHEQIQVKRDNRPFIQIRPYARIAARLAAVQMANADVIPPFNPFRLYAADKADPAPDSDTAASGTRSDVAIRVLELLGGILPNEDGQEFDNAEIIEIVARSVGEQAEQADDGKDPALARGSGPNDLAARSAGAGVANTSTLVKSAAPVELAEDSAERREVRVFRAGRGDTLQKVLLRAGAEAWQARAMAEASRSIFADTALLPGQEVHVTLVASLTKQGRMEPARFSVFADGHDHKVSVMRNGAGEFVPSATPIDASLAQAAMNDGDTAGSTSLYASLYNAALAQGLSPDVILQILRIHAFETDFRRKVGPSDSFELFFDLKEEPGYEPELGELLVSSLTAGGDNQRFWRFRTPDGIVDYYDQAGSNSRKFLMRRPVRGEAVQLISGFGMRRHPLLHFVRMHAGVDWAGPIGTPIMAAGSGVIEEAKFKGDYGNYVRIRHANGYSTAYAHMSRFAPGMSDGTKVRQGQIIGFIGSTGLSTGPHLHYEVLVNDRHVDPMSIQVPRERQLSGKQLADFHKERARIDELMRRPPVQTVSR
jgi:murein DD-endopeptidase MepM/ murein hydrolase activator NlpD